MSTVGIGVIGTGFARRVQIPALQACAEARLISVSSASLANAEATAEEFGFKHFSGEWRDTVGHPDVDLVCITTPPFFHREMVLAAVEHGKHILCEKPMAMNVAEATEMRDAVHGYPRLAVIDHELRYQPGRLKAHEMLRDRAIGRVRHVKAVFKAPHRGDPNIPWNWWSDAAQGGGSLGAIGSHIIDSFHWLLGTPARRVSAQLHTHCKLRRSTDGVMREVTSDDEANLLIRFEGNELTADATGLASISMTEFPIYQNTLEVHGTDGSLKLEQNGELFIGEPGDSEWKHIGVDLGSPIDGVPDTGFSRAFMSFAPKLVRAVAANSSGVEHAATFDEGLDVQRVLDAARRAHVEGASVSISY